MESTEVSPALRNGLTPLTYSDCGLAEVTQNAAECPGTPPERLLDLAWAYRAFALEAPHLYELIYGPRVRETLPLPSDRDEARRLQQIIACLFHEGQERGCFRQTGPEDAAGDACVRDGAVEVARRMPGR